MNVLKYDESPSRTGANGFLHNGQRDRPMTLNLSLIPEYRPAVSECDAADMTPLIFYLCDSQHVRLLATRNLISSGLLTHDSHLPIAFQMFLAWAWLPPMLRRGFLMQMAHSCIALVIAKITQKGLV